MNHIFTAKSIHCTSLSAGSLQADTLEDSDPHFSSVSQRNVSNVCFSAGTIVCTRPSNQPFADPFADALEESLRANDSEKNGNTEEGNQESVVKDEVHFYCLYYVSKNYLLRKQAIFAVLGKGRRLSTVKRIRTKPW